MTLDELCEEHRLMTIGPLWLQEVRDRCERVVQSYPPQIYAVTGNWSSSIEDLVQEVITERLLNQDQAQWLVDNAGTLTDLRRLLIRQIKLTLAQGRRRTVIDNLLGRSAKILSNPPFEVITPGREWRLAGIDVLNRVPKPAELRHAANLVRPTPIVPSKPLEKAPTVYRTSDLQVLLEIVVRSLPTAIRRTDLDSIFKDLLTPFLPTFLDGGDAASAAPPPLSPEEDEMTRTVAQNLAERFNETQAFVMAAKLANASDEDVAAALSVSRPTAAARKREAFAIAEAALADMSEHVQLATLDRLRVRLVGLWPPAPPTADDEPDGGTGS